MSYLVQFVWMSQYNGFTYHYVLLRLVQVSPVLHPILICKTELDESIVTIRIYSIYYIGHKLMFDFGVCLYLNCNLLLHIK